MTDTIVKRDPPENGCHAPDSSPKGCSGELDGGSRLTVGSLFAGIGGFDEALRRCGGQVTFAAEMDAKCNSVRRRHFPDEQTVNDVRDVRGSGFGCDILTAGWPCQGNSVAGRRGGMADERSGLWGEVVRVLAEQRPEWFLGENVPGILSVNEGRDWLTVLRDLAKLGYGTAYRVLDAQWFGVPQRRRRVFVVGCLGDWRRAAEVLFERSCLPWHPTPSREAGAGVAGGITERTRSGGRQCEWQHDLAYSLDNPGDGGRAQTRLIGPLQAHSARHGHAMTTQQAAESGQLIAFGGNNTTGPIDVATACNAHGGPHGRQDFETETFVAVCFSSKFNKRDGVSTEVSPALRTMESAGPPAVAFMENVRAEVRTSDVTDSLKGPGGKVGQGYQAALIGGMAVRRLTPVECERLQGFPDNWTATGENGEQIADGPRYRMLGNAVAVPCVEWIGRRLVAQPSPG